MKKIKFKRNENTIINNKIKLKQKHESLYNLYEQLSVKPIDYNFKKECEKIKWTSDNNINFNLMETIYGYIYVQRFFNETIKNPLYRFYYIINNQYDYIMDYIN